ncbi:MAG: T9SS type A sorting domain-containing protein, partial [Bacteroidetes bacterium]|nr:T9SS type A sorting domain-containing protein [Bacteroidota bacterium]
DSNLYYKATTHQESYLWFDGTHKNPLLNITKSSVFNTMSSTTTKTKSILVSEISSNNSISQYDWSLASENIFPNPTSGKATISFDLKEKSNTEISVFDMQGREAIHNELGNLEAGTNQKEIDISDIPQGTYLIRISAGDGYSYKKIIKK